ncbi:LytR family transcriptional regulator [Anaerobacillus alkalilacustris]|uniref:Polyisoprenyl-teichoic acid--peptidoglycan teichoic acid transferase TagU n=1 Tax=Anaerobacillus alkalilacustris TaxID=393763 RepID=A0A1S2LGP5_9BACI|nr:LCP family protein [Anaerobacillus alkalilacustris]OIJ11253.1 LytR family transcriptional regulator [Anaerobacillus alkalilacustris]
MTKRKKLIIIVSLIIGLPLLGILGYGYHLYNSVVKTVNVMHQPIERETKRQIEVQQKEPLSFLLLGIDADEGTSGRTDTIIVLTVNPNTESMKMLSIPRDTRTEIIGRGFDDKINHAHAFGGPKMTIETVENFLDIPIDYYATVNMSGFKDIVDAVGGVTVNNSFEFRSSGHTFAEGPVDLNGTEALAFVRMRKSDPRGDFGRNDRQRQVIDAIIKEGAQLTSIARVEEILGAVGTNVRTDLDFDQMMKIQSNYKDARRSSEEITISGSGAMMGGIYYYVVSEDERLRVSNLLKEHLEIQ